MVEDRDVFPPVTERTAEAAQSLRQEIVQLDVDGLVREITERGGDVSRSEVTAIVGLGGVLEQALGGVAAAAVFVPLDRAPVGIYKGIDVPEIRRVFATSPSGDLFWCELGEDTCGDLRVDPEDHVDLLRGRLTIDGIDYMYVDNQSGRESNGVLQADGLTSGWRHQELADSSTLSLNAGITAKVDEDSRTLELSAQGVDVGRAVIWGGRLDGWTIRYRGMGDNSSRNDVPGERHDLRGLTGCVTLRDVIVTVLRVSVTDAAGCEDSLHLLRTTGDLAEVVIEGSTSDAVDTDFSTVAFGKVRVAGSGNDCLDLSAGNYRVEVAILGDCSDKAISVGEAAQVRIGDLQIDRALVGVASKDSASTVVEQAVMVDVGICGTSYRKKQEFSGASLRFGSVDCPAMDYRAQAGSLVEVGG